MATSRAVWQQAAKRAPKLESIISKIDTKPVNPTDLDASFPLEESFFSHSSDPKWWLQLQPGYMYQRGLEFQKSHQFVENKDYSIDSRSSKESFEFVDDLGSFESKKSYNLIESYDLDRPMNTGLEQQKIKSKTKILEALCHSQTRAREAELAAKKAYAEKEHAIKIVFRQATQLFAYRQWIYVLQLENLCYQINNKKGDPGSSVGAFSRSKIRKVDKSLKKGKGTRIGRGFGRNEYDLGGYVVVFVVGLGIVGAGLLLGWTVGWMLI